MASLDRSLSTTFLKSSSFFFLSLYNNQTIAIINEYFNRMLPAVLFPVPRPLKLCAESESYLQVCIRRGMRYFIFT